MLVGVLVAEIDFATELWDSASTPKILRCDVGCQDRPWLELPSPIDYYWPEKVAPE